MRWRMLETLREFAGECLESGQKEDAARAHARFFAGLAADAGPHLLGADEALWLERLSREHDNLRAALRCCLQMPDLLDTGLQMAVHAGSYWSVRGHGREGVELLTGLLEADSARAPSRLRAKALWTTCRTLHALNDYAEAERLAHVCRDAARAVGEPHGLAGALHMLGATALARGDYGPARLFFEQMRDANVAHGIRDGFAPMGLGHVAFRVGDFAEARRQFEAGLAQAREKGYQSGIAFALACVASSALETGEFERARACLCETMEIKRALHDRIGVAYTLKGFGELAQTQERDARAARLYAAALTLSETLDAGLSADQRAVMDSCRASLRAALGESEFADAEAEGRALSWEQAIALALQESPVFPTAASKPVYETLLIRSPAILSAVGTTGKRSAETDHAGRQNLLPGRSDHLSSLLLKGASRPCFLLLCAALSAASPCPACALSRSPGAAAAATV